MRKGMIQKMLNVAYRYFVQLLFNACCFCLLLIHTCVSHEAMSLIMLMCCSYSTNEGLFKCSAWAVLLPDEAQYAGLWREDLATCEEEEEGQSAQSLSYLSNELCNNLCVGGGGGVKHSFKAGWERFYFVKIKWSLTFSLDKVDSIML